jgi:hypothetical protein
MHVLSEAEEKESALPWSLVFISMPMESIV